MPTTQNYTRLPLSDTTPIRQQYRIVNRLGDEIILNYHAMQYSRKLAREASSDCLRGVYGDSARELKGILQTLIYVHRGG